MNQFTDEDGFYPDQEYYYVETKATIFRANNLTNCLAMWHEWWSEHLDNTMFDAIVVGKIKAKV